MDRREQLAVLQVLEWYRKTTANNALAVATLAAGVIANVQEEEAITDDSSSTTTFIPRSLRLRGAKEPQRPKATKSKARSAAAAQRDDTPTPGPRFNPAPVTPEYLAQLAAGVELIFTDYAHQEPESAKWLQERYRSVDRDDKFVHLSSILEHSNIVNLKPPATQILLRQSIQEHATEALELSSNTFFVRRRPSTYPLPFVPHNSFSVTDDDGLSFWDQRTIYVEPHIRHLCNTPAKVAHWLKAHGEMKAKWLPVQAVHTLYNSCAFVVLSGSVVHQQVWDKWREVEKPEDWKIMTKVEHTKRTEEYLELLKKNKANIKRQRNAHHSAADIAKSAQAADASEEQPVSKKRKWDGQQTGKKTRLGSDEGY